MIASDVRDFLEKLGYDVQTSLDHREHMQLWREWYRGKVDSFHNYVIFNGIKEVKKTKKSLGMAKKSCEDWADLLLNEKVKITIDDAYQDILDNCLNENDFQAQSNALIELSFALGTGAFVEYASGATQNGCQIDYINGNMIFPLRIKNGKITDVAFASQIGNNKYYVNIHEKVGNQYRIENVIFDAEKGGNYSVDELPDGVQRVIYSPVALFQIIKPNMVNNSDIDEPMGMAVFANALDEMMDCDEKFDSYFNEFQLGKKRLFLDPSVINVIQTPKDKNGRAFVRPAFDPNDTIFYAYGGGSDMKEKIKETEFNLRVDEHSQALQDALNLFADKVGFGSDHYVFKEGKVYTNTANIISSNSKMFRRLRKHELILKKALEDMVKAVLYVSNGIVYSNDIQVDFDDSIIEDKDTERKQDQADMANGTLRKDEYRAKWRNETLEQAQKNLPVEADALP